jgi:hypothetical protein
MRWSDCAAATEKSASKSKTAPATKNEVFAKRFITLSIPNSRRGKTLRRVQMVVDVQNRLDGVPHGRVVLLIERVGHVPRGPNAFG